jgi:hypothetical protein
MLHIRQVKPGHFTHEGLGELSIAARLADIGLWVCADKHGRFEWKPKTLKLSIMPFDVIDFEALMIELVDGGFVERYEVDGQKYGRRLNWEEHQGLGTRERASKFEYPAPTQTPRRAGTAQAQTTHSAMQVDVGVGSGVGVDADSGVDIPPTIQPKTTGGMDGRAHDSSKPTSKTGHEKSLWHRLFDSYENFYNGKEAFEEEFRKSTPKFPGNTLPDPTGLPREGIKKLEASLPGLHDVGYSTDQIVAGWAHWLEERFYPEAYPASESPIKFPVALFADEAEVYIERAIKEAQEEASACTVPTQSPALPTHSKIATEIFEEEAL